MGVVTPLELAAILLPLPALGAWGLFEDWRRRRIERVEMRQKRETELSGQARSGKEKHGGAQMLRSVLLVTLVWVIAGAAVAGDREDYGDCVMDELERGTSLAAIGETCLRLVKGPPEPKSVEEAEEPYPYEKSLRKVLTDQGALFDPESARFKDLAYSAWGFPAWCGQFNAKNRLGGYVGWEYFALRDRYKGIGRVSDYIDFAIGGRELEGTCKTYGAWVQENW